MANGGSAVGVEAVASIDAESNREIEEMLAYRERQLSQRALESLGGGALESAAPLMSPELAREFVSDKAYEMIVRYETGGRKYYENVYKSAPVWPGYSSGVTIGFGYDLGFVDEDEFIEVWGKLLPAQDVERLKEGIGLNGNQAQSLARRLKDIRISWEVAETVFARNTLPKFVGQTKAALPNFELERLHPHSTGALVSLVFNRGPDFKSNTDKRLEMRKIRAHMAKPVFAEIPDELRDMKRLWTSKGLQSRRDEEADLFEKGLELVRAKISVPQPAPVPRPDPVARPGDAPVAPGAPVAAGGAGDVLAGQPMPQMQGQAPAIPLPPGASADVAQAPAASASPASPAAPGVQMPPEMGGLESMYGTPAPQKVSLEDDWLEYDQLPLEQLEKKPSLESPGPSYSISHVRWAADDNEIPDYRSFAGIAAAEGTFELTAADIDTIISANRYKPTVDPSHGKILFGLRGCQLVGETDKQIDRDALKLRLARPDHKTFRCTIGVLDTRTRKLSGFIASTVPNRTYVYTCWQRARDDEDLAGNMLPTGCYGYIVGQHNSTPSAFVLRLTLDKKRTVAVWRSTDDVTYTVQDDVDVCQPGDNIHPAYTSSQAEFSSAGCQTIRGDSKGGHNGEWALFRIAAGLPKDGNGRYGTPYSYVLMTGLEAKAASEMRKRNELADEAKVRSKLVRLRQGSQGDEVKALQTALGLQPTGVMAAAEVEKLAEWQKKSLGFNDGIYTMDLDVHLNANILGGMPPPPAPAAPPAPAVATQPSPVDRPDPVSRPDAGTPVAGAATPAMPDLGGGGQTAQGWALEGVGGGATAGRSVFRRPAALSTASAKSHIQALLKEEDAQLLARLGLLTDQICEDPRRAGQLDLAVQRLPAGSERHVAAGHRVYSRIEPEIFRMLCGSSGMDAGERAEINRALSLSASDKTGAATAIAGSIMSSGLAAYGVALVMAALCLRRFGQTSLEDTCRIWGVRRRMGEA